MDTQSITLGSQTQLTMHRSLRGLYVITDPALTPDLPRAVLQALLGGARIVQYRDKKASWQQRLEHAMALKKLCRQHQACFIVNDDVNLAQAIEADGVHLGEEDMPLSQARARLGPQALIGVSCYNQLARALRAQQVGADYVAFGRFFPSYSKPTAKLASVDLIKQARPLMNIPIVAIGGMTALNSAPLIAAGVDALAVIHAVFTAKEVTLACKDYQHLFAGEKTKEDNHDAFTNSF